MPNATAKSEAQRIEDAIDVERIDRDLYRSKSLWKPGAGRGVFGGQTIAQATWSATLSIRTDEPDTTKSLHSLHCYFLNFGDDERPILYTVQRLRDGRSYSTRNVLATQNGVPIFTLMCSFARAEPEQPKRAYGFPNYIRPKQPPGFPKPEDCLPTEDRLQKVLDRFTEMPRKIQETISRYRAERILSAIEVRNCDMQEYGDVVTSKTDSQKEPNQAYWFRSRAPVRKDPSFQKCVLAYASDMQFIGSAARAVGLGARTDPQLGMLASLDHAMYFYDDDIDATEFMLFWMECPIVGQGRGTVQGRIYKSDGTLAVVCTQEGVVRANL